MEPIPTIKKNADLLLREVRRYDRVPGFAPRWKH